MAIFEKGNKQVQGKISNFAVNRDHSFTSKKTKVVTLTHRYSSGHLIHIYAGVGDHPCFLTFYSYNLY